MKLKRDKHEINKTREGLFDLY